MVGRQWPDSAGSPSPIPAPPPGGSSRKLRQRARSSSVTRGSRLSARTPRMWPPDFTPSPSARPKTYPGRSAARPTSSATPRRWTRGGDARAGWRRGPTGATRCVLNPTPAITARISTISLAAGSPPKARRAMRPRSRRCFRARRGLCGGAPCRSSPRPGGRGISGASSCSTWPAALAPSSTTCAPPSRAPRSWGSTSPPPI